MKHLNEWLDFGKKAGDDFVNSLLDIVEKENIEIGKSWDEYYFNVDDTSYEMNWSPNRNFDNIADYYYITIKSGPNKGSYKYLIISKKYYSRLKKLYKKQDKIRIKEEEDKILSELPDISEIGRTSKKYNL